MSAPRTSIHRGLRLRIALGGMTLLNLIALRAGAAEPVGDDVFVMAREALLRDKPSRESRFVAKLPGGSRLKLLEAGDAYLKVEVVSGLLPDADRTAPAHPARTGASIGFLSRDVAAIFSTAGTGTSDLVAAGRALAASEPHRRIAAAFLHCAAERLRTAGGNPEVEVLLGETAEALAKAGGPFPPGLEVSRRPSAASPGSGEGPPSPSWTYTGDAFRRALAGTEKAADGEQVLLRDRARAGVLRQQYPEVSPTLALLWQETAGWLELTETAGDISALRSSSERLGSSSLALGRFLLAANRLDDLDKLEQRVRGAGGRVSSRLPGETCGGRLLARSRILRTLRGNATAPFPQEARAQLGPKEVTVRIEGKIGALQIIEEAVVGSTRVGPRRMTAIPVLPVPGSLRLAPDGRTAAWIEVVSPSKLVPVVASLDRDEPAREVALLSNGRPLRDQGLAHVLSTVSGWSRDGQRLGVTIQAWNDTPGPDPRFSVVSVTTGELLFETSKDVKGFQRLIQ